MKKISTYQYLVCAAILACACALAQQTTVKKVAPVGAKGLDGKSLYQEFCAVCHGTDGKGGGPAASALKMPPADLTQIARRNGGTFPDTRVMSILKGETSISAHGSQDMPTWGKTFNDVSGNLTVAQGRMHALVMYLEQMQAK
ncbi:MAG TPA: c-type cytochrome [Candidatus Acidoferrales bacterium]|nr:c-type cytochrome [Candidatus Acidoferrales bacterium]